MKFSSHHGLELRNKDAKQSTTGVPWRVEKGLGQRNMKHRNPKLNALFSRENIRDIFREALISAILQKKTYTRELNFAFFKMMIWRSIQTSCFESGKWFNNSHAYWHIFVTSFYVQECHKTILKETCRYIRVLVLEHDVCYFVWSNTFVFITMFVRGLIADKRPHRVTLNFASLIFAVIIRTDSLISRFLFQMNELTN